MSALSLARLMKNTQPQSKKCMRVLLAVTKAYYKYREASLIIHNLKINPEHIRIT